MIMDEQQQQSLADIVTFVTKAHHGQYRKGNGLPFVVHPFSVLKIICGWGINDHVTLKATLAHDVLEDCDVSYNQLEEVIGDEAVFIVDELTFKPDMQRLVAVSKQKAEFISGIGKKSVRALVIKLADRIDNTMDFYQDDKSYALKYWKKATDILNAFFSRKSEIVTLFGEKVFDSMRSSIDRVDEILYKLS